MTGLSPKKRCLNFFLRYYNTEREKNFEYRQKLDEIDQSQKMPDFLCSDGDDYLLVEVTSIHDDLQGGSFALTPQYIKEVFSPLLTEAGEKFTSAKAKYPESVSVLLIENRNLLISEDDPDDCSDIRAVIAPLGNTHIDYVYLMSLDRENIVRLMG